MSAREADFFDQYFSYTSNAEPPAIFNRWALIASIGALLGRQYFFEHGHFCIYPNTYTMLIGSAGTRKSSAIKLAKKLISAAGYTQIAAEKSTKEKFLLDLSGEGENGVDSMDDLLETNLFGEKPKEDREIFIMADEFNDFFGNGNMEFISLLGSLWDFEGTYRNRIKNGKSVDIHNPTISILGGNTPTAFASAFPSEAIGQGFFSRILLIYGEPNGKRITFPRFPEPRDTEFIVNYLREIKRTVLGKSTLNRNAERILDSIYQRDNRSSDIRFEPYFNRRLNHLIKLCLIISASRLSSEITEYDVVYANTILTHAEYFMPKALGQFGKAKNSDVSHKVLELIYKAEEPLTVTDIWPSVSSDLDKIAMLTEILMNLKEAGLIQFTKAGGGFLPRRRLLGEGNEFVNYQLLTEEERMMKL